MKVYTFKIGLFILVMSFLMKPASAQSTYETNISTAAWVENFDEMGSYSNALLPGGWVFSQGTQLPVYSSPLNAPLQYSFSNPQNFTTNSAAENSRACTKSYDGFSADGGTAPTSGSRINWGDQTTGGKNRSVGFYSSSPSWVSPTNFVMFGFTNNTGSNILSVALNFNIKRYIFYSASAAAFFYYSSDGANWTEVSAGEVGPYNTSSTRFYFFSTGPNASNVSLSISGLNVSNSAPFYLCWQFVVADTTGSGSQGLGLDDVNMAFTLAAPVFSLPPAPTLLSNINAADNAILTWNTIPGYIYQIQFSAVMPTSNWTVIGAITASGTSANFTDTNANTRNVGFYRINALGH